MMISNYIPLPEYHDLIYLHGGIKFRRVYVPHCLYPSVCWWISRLAPFLSCSGWCSYKHECINISVVGCRDLWVPRREKQLHRDHTELRAENSE